MYYMYYYYSEVIEICNRLIDKKLLTGYKDNGIDTVLNIQQSIIWCRVDPQYIDWLIVFQLYLWRVQVQRLLIAIGKL